MIDSKSLPASIQEALSAEPLSRGRWDKAIAPHYIGLFLWIVFFDRLAGDTLIVGGLIASILAAAIGGVFCFVLLYLPLALWGESTRRPLPVLAASTFGARGSIWIPGFVLGIVNVVWFSVTIRYATELTLRALAAAGLIDPARIAPLSIGSIAIESPVFLVTSLLWAIAAALIGTLALKLIAAVMGIYPVFPALAIGAVAAISMRGLAFSPYLRMAPSATSVPSAWLAATTMIQIVFGYFATAGTASAEYGTVARDRRDVFLGGFVGIAIASCVVATLALLTVAGYFGQERRSAFENARTERSTSIRLVGDVKPDLIGTNAINTINKPIHRFPIDASRSNAVDRESLRYVTIVERSIGGPWACLILVVLATACLGPSSYTSARFSRHFHDALPFLKKWRCALIGALIAWPATVIASDWDLTHTFTFTGALAAPIVAAVSADAIASRFREPIIRSNWNLRGMIAWAFGAIVGLAPSTSEFGIVPAKIARSFQPAAVYAFITTFVIFSLLNLRGFVSKSASADR